MPNLPICVDVATVLFVDLCIKLRCARLLFIHLFAYRNAVHAHRCLFQPKSDLQHTTSTHFPLSNNEYTKTPFTNNNKIKTLIEQRPKKNRKTNGK